MINTTRRPTPYVLHFRGISRTEFLSKEDWVGEPEIAVKDHRVDVSIGLPQGTPRPEFLTEAADRALKEAKVRNAMYYETATKDFVELIPSSCHPLGNGLKEEVSLPGMRVVRTYFMEIVDGYNFERISSYGSVFARCDMVVKSFAAVPVSMISTKTFTQYRTVHDATVQWQDGIQRPVIEIGSIPVTTHSEESFTPGDLRSMITNTVQGSFDITPSMFY